MSSPHVANYDRQSEDVNGTSERRPVAGSYAPGRPGYQPHKDARHTAPGPDYATGPQDASRRVHDGSRDIDSELRDGSGNIHIAEARLARDQALAERAQREHQRSASSSNSSSSASGDSDGSGQADDYERRRRHFRRACGGGVSIDERSAEAMAGGIQPKLTDKIIGRTEKAVGIVLNRPAMQEKGEIRYAAGKAAIDAPY